MDDVVIVDGHPCSTFLDDSRSVARDSLEIILVCGEKKGVLFERIARLLLLVDVRYYLAFEREY